MILLLGLIVFGQARVLGEGGSVLQTCGAVRELSREQAAQGLEVRLKGVVTLRPYNQGGALSFTMDDGAGLWVSPQQPVERTNFPDEIRPGDVVEVVGKTNEGRFSPQVIARRVTVVGRAQLPAAREATSRALTTGALDSQRVRLEGVVQAAQKLEGGTTAELRLLVRNAAGIFAFSLLGEQPAGWENLVDARVRVTGVCLSFFNSRRQFLGARLFTNSARDVEVVRAGNSNPFTAPRETLSEVLTFAPEGADLHRRQVRGVVTLASPGRYFYLQEGSSALRVNTRQATVLEPGDVVEASGFLDLEHHRGELNEAVFRRIDHESPPQPVSITREQAYVREPQTVFAVPQDFDDRLVSIEGLFIGFDERPGELARLNLMSGGALVPVEFVATSDLGALSQLRLNSVLRVSGVCQMSYSGSHPVVDWPQPTGMRLLVRDARDVAVLRAAPWWTPQRLIIAVSGLFVILLIALAWVALLRRQVAQRGQQLADAMRQRRDAAVEFESALRERNRLAADLHDTMEQSLTGMALQVEAGQALRSVDPDRSEQHLALARQLLARSREDLRRSIWNLRANPLEKHNLAGALREVAESRGTGLEVRITTDCRGEERELPDFVAANMLLLAQEGITNALKHAEASEISLLLEFGVGVVRLTISDNGKGFDPATVHGLEGGHFGLQGMRERAKRLGGTLQIQSAPGAGTAIIATVQD